MSAVATRAAAASLLVRILDQGQTLDEALSQEEAFSALEGSDRGFARAIVSAALRHLGQINHIISRHLTGRPFADLSPAVQHLLQIGAAQICVLKTPVHAAVSETVEAARQFDGARQAGGLVNAVLRKILPDALETAGLTAANAWPVWFQTLMTDAIGADHAEALAISMQQTPPLDLTVKSDAADWAERLGGMQLGPHTIRLESGAVETLEGYAEGSWWVQDAAASLPVACLLPVKGERILDLCAAPGGKTLQIAASGADVVALDRSAKRLRLVEQNLQRTGLTAECVAADATKWKSDTQFDGVLVDAPCSALGTLRRHPEGPWVKRPEDIARFPDIQARLLEAAAARVRPGGRLVYCVCTPLPGEGADIVNAFLERHPYFRRDQITREDAGVFSDAITSAGDIRTLPPLLAEIGGCDAFYISRLVNIAD